MNCAEANKVDLVDYLYSLGFTPTKISGNDYWYLSPLRDERTASFKVNSNKNVWYDHGTGNGGTLIDFTIQYFKCGVQTVLEKVSAYISTNTNKLSRGSTSSDVESSDAKTTDTLNTNQFSFQKQNQQQQLDAFNNSEEPPFQLHKNSLMNYTDAAETATQIIAAKQPITNPALCRYLKERGINKNIADTHCHQVKFRMNNNDKEFIAIGFKNNAGGYELRNDFFKLSSSPKYVTYINNYEQEINTKTELENFNIVSQNALQGQAGKCAKKNNEKSDRKDESESINFLAKSIAVFEGFFDFLTFQTIHQNQKQPLTNLPIRQTSFLVLNSLSFFERSLLLMEQYDHVHLYLDHDNAGRKCVDQALKRSIKYEDKSGLYKGYKDLNDWLVHFGKLQKSETLKQSKGLGLR